MLFSSQTFGEGLEASDIFAFVLSMSLPWLVNVFTKAIISHGVYFK